MSEQDGRDGLYEVVDDAPLSDRPTVKRQPEDEFEGPGPITMIWLLAGSLVAMVFFATLVQAAYVAWNKS